MRAPDLPNPTLTPLAAKLSARILASAPISFHDYMEACLYDAEYGYYRTKDPLGRGGDFITAPEISQVFGELIGLWVGEVWRQMGEPTGVRLIELGPGRGTLMADALRALRVLPGFLENVTIHLIETSEPLRRGQYASLAGAPCSAQWHEDMSNVPAGPAILIANEFFDCLPVRQFIFSAAADVWCERMVTFEDGAFKFATAAYEGGVPPHPNPLPKGRGGRHGSPLSEGKGGGKDSPLSKELEGRVSNPLSEGIEGREGSAFLRGRAHSTVSSPLGEKDRMRGDFNKRLTPAIDVGEIDDGAVLEYRPGTEKTIRQFALRAANAPFAALIIDYGYAQPSFGETVQAVRHHRFADIFASPGEADLTAHVDFSHMKQLAADENLAASGPMPMGEWLLRLGVEARLCRLIQGASEIEAADLRSGISRLVDPAQMGALFKVMALTDGVALPLPPFS